MNKEERKAMNKHITKWRKQRTYEEVEEEAINAEIAEIEGMANE